MQRLLTHDLVIIGAGLTGLACAHKLLTAYACKARIVVLESAQNSGGRAVTARHENFVFDYGANYLSTDGFAPDVQTQIAQLLEQPQLAKAKTLIQKPVYVLKENGDIEESERQSQKINFTDGLQTLSDHLGADTDVRLRHEVTALTIGSDGLIEVQGQSFSQQNNCLEEFQFLCKSVLLATPAPPALRILQNTHTQEAQKAHLERICQRLQESRYLTVISVALGYKTALVAKYYALLNLDRKHDISWLGLEEAKPGHIAKQMGSLLVVQMAHQWSTLNYDLQDEKIAEKVVEKLQILNPPLLNATSNKPDYFSVHRWLHALPDNQIDLRQGIAAQSFAALEQCGLYLSGDYLLGKGRVAFALSEGFALANKIAPKI